MKELSGLGAGWRPTTARLVDNQQFRLGLHLKPAAEGPTDAASASASASAAGTRLPWLGTVRAALGSAAARRATTALLKAAILAWHSHLKPDRMVAAVMVFEGSEREVKAQRIAAKEAAARFRGVRSVGVRVYVCACVRMCVCACVPACGCVHTRAGVDPPNTRSNTLPISTIAVSTTRLSLRHSSTTIPNSPTTIPSFGAAQAKAGYELTFAIAYLRDFALTHAVAAESFETFVRWDTFYVWGTLCLIPAPPTS